MTENTKLNNLLNLQSIAGWQIVYAPVEKDPEYRVSLPALQRGAVWRVKQIEELWDSILRGFPIGAFLLMPYDEKKGNQDFKHQQQAENNPTHHLLDGQQRATGIALGFFNPWHSEIESTTVKSVLWIDIATSPKGRDVEFVFRAVTRAHPWGYLRSDPNSRVSEHQIRLALRAFKFSNELIKDKRPSEIPLTEVWPWDAEAPVPVPILIDAILQAKGNIRTAKTLAWQIIKQHSFMSPIEENPNESDASLKHWLAQQNKATKAFCDASSEESALLEFILTRLNQSIEKYIVPIITMPRAESLSTNLSTSMEDKSDPIETLFIRVNSSGTPLEGEELIYSLIKSVWIEAPKAIDKLSHRMATPSRISLLASRLVLAREQARKQSNQDRLRLTPSPGVNEFRRLMHGLNQDIPDFQYQLETFISGDGLSVFKQAHDFLTKGDFSLPPVLASEMAQRSQDVFFLFLRWLDLMYQQGKDPTQISDVKRRQTIGFLTALAWFSKDKYKAVDAIWNELQRANPENLTNFFTKKQFKKTCHLDERGNLRMVPIPHPDILEKALELTILGHRGCSNTITTRDSDIWKSWNWWQWLIDEKRPKCVSKYLTPMLHSNEENLPDGETTTDRVRDGWYHFLETLWGSRAILLYVQRDWLNSWFPDFDPSLPEFLEDKNRPWDYDHIHPQRYMCADSGNSLRGIPRLIHDWHNSIGNLRAWPLEANRSDGDTSPAIKLDNVSDEENRYGIHNGKDERAASFINEEDWEHWWKHCVPDNGNRHYLANNEFYKERAILVNGIVRRFVKIYRSWYTSLRLEGISH